MENLGRYVRLFVDVNGLGSFGAGTPDWQEVPQMKDKTIDASTEMVDVTHSGTGGRKRRLPGDRDGKVSFDLVWYKGDPVVKYIRDQHNAQSAPNPNPKKTYFMVDSRSVGGDREEAACWIDSMTEESPRADAITCSLSLVVETDWVRSA